MNVGRVKSKGVIVYFKPADLKKLDRAVKGAGYDCRNDFILDALAVAVTKYEKNGDFKFKVGRAVE